MTVALRCELKNDNPVDMMGDGPILAIALLAGLLCVYALVLKLVGGGAEADWFDNDGLVMSEADAASNWFESITL